MTERPPITRATEIGLRPARAGDLESVRALLVAADLPTQGLEDQFGDAYVVATGDGMIVGAAGMETHDRFGLLRSVVVAQSLRGQGLGERLTRDRIAWARSRCLEAVYLLTTTAATYFSRLGFASADRASAPEALKRSPQFVAVCPSSAACMRLDLNSSPGR